MYFTTTCVLLFFLALGYGDRPCAKYRSKAGSVCVCNSTYCDTISAPSKLPIGQFHLYSTADKSPGFNHATGFFRIQPHSPQATKITVDAKKTFQKIRGFGGAFTDSFGYNFNILPKRAQEKLLKSYFSEDGIEYNVCRVVLGSCDFSLRDYNYLPKHDPTMKTFKLTKDDHIYKITQMKKALKLSKRKLEFLGSVWSTPKWIRMSKTTLITYIKNEYKQLWANYYAKALSAFKKEGIHFWAVTTGNEPVTLYPMRHTLLNMSSVVMFPEEQRDWLANNLGPALRKASLNTSIYLLDDMRVYTPWWIETVMRNPKAKDYVAGVGLHWYVDEYSPPDIFDKLIKQYPDLDIIYTESSFHAPAKMTLPTIKQFKRESNEKSAVISAPILGSWKRAGKYAEDIIQNLQHWVTTYIDWNLALNMEGGPNRIAFPCDASIIINTKNKKEFYKQPMFYVMGHFSKFIPPGSKIINLLQVKDPKELPTDKTVSNPIPKRKDYKLKYVGARNPNKSYTLVFYNPKPTTVQVTVHDPKRGYAVLTLEANSINTLIYW